MFRFLSSACEQHASLDCVFHRIGCFDNSSNQSINVVPDWITGHQHVVVHALALNVLDGLNQAQQHGPLAFPRMSKNQLASELASLGIRALVGKLRHQRRAGGPEADVTADREARVPPLLMVRGQGHTRGNIGRAQSFP